MPPQSKDALHYTVWKQLFAEEPTRSQRTQIRIAEAAIKLYAKDGAQATIFETIAKEAKVSRALVLRYFPTYSALMQFMAKYIRAQFQELAVRRLTAADKPEAKLAAYVDSTFEWVTEYSHHARVWLYFFYLCSLNKKTRELNTDLVDIGHQRIEKLIDDGQKQGVFPKGNSKVIAKSIQILITGALVAYVSEDRAGELEAMRDGIHRACRACLSVK